MGSSVGRCCQAPARSQEQGHHRWQSAQAADLVAITGADITKPCNKRDPGSGLCGLGGFVRIHAILGASDQCIAVNPSDMAVALRPLDAQVETVNADNATRFIPIAEFHRLPGMTPQIETTLRQGESHHRRYSHRRRRQASTSTGKSATGRRHAFALVSVAAGRGRGRGEESVRRVSPSAGFRASSLGGVAQAEEVCRGAGERGDLAAVASDVLSGARGFGGNDFKILLTRRTLRAVLTEASVT